MECPDDFKCPITLEVMTDPVILTSGHTFDRVSIQKWLDSGNRTCPVTKMVLPRNSSLIPNHALRSLISNYIGSNRRSSSRCGDFGAILKTLTFPADASRLNRLRELAKNNPDFRQLVLDSGAASSVVLKHAGCSEKPEIQETALKIVLDLSLHGDDAKVGLVADGAVDFLAAALRSGSPCCQALAATTLTSLAVLQVNKCTIGAHPLVISDLVQVLRKGKGRETRESTTAIFVLCSFPENRRRAIRSGVVPVLVELAGCGIERAIEVLELLWKLREGREEMEKMEGLVRVLVIVSQKGSSRGVAEALLLLNLLCNNSPKLRSEAIEGGMVGICEGLAEESGKIGKNASILMGTLNFFLDQDNLT